MVGANGERFLIIVAGTEIIYIDGKRLKRGANYDYIIDYNLGEITFTNNQLITKDKRIVAEYSYTDFNYIRSVITTNINHRLTKRLNWRFNFFSEQDLKGATTVEGLTDIERNVLTSVGDQLNNAVVSSVKLADSSAVNAGLFYQLIDTTVGSQVYRILVYQPIKANISYTARFSLIEGGGNYKRAQNSANGVVYEWVAPDQNTGVPKGTHEPISKLIAPRQQQLYNLGADYNWSPQGGLKVDASLSNLDVNTFSSNEDGDNQGLAARIAFYQKLSLGKKVDSIPQALSAYFSGNYEIKQANFSTMEPYRGQEFNRDWNILDDVSTTEHLYRFSVQLDRIKVGFLKYDISGFHRQGYADALRQAAVLKVDYKNWQSNGRISYLTQKSATQNSVFFRPYAETSCKLFKAKQFTLGLAYEQEYNTIRDLVTDTLSALSFNFQVLRFFASWQPDKGVLVKLEAARRYDFTAEPTIFVQNSWADDISIESKWTKSKWSQLMLRFKYRNLFVEDAFLDKLEPKATYLGRITHNLKDKTGFIQLNTIYELGSGQHQRIEYTFINIDKGQGTHIWIDRNEDGVEQVNEFEEAIFTDQADYLRISLLTSNFVQTDNLTFSQSLQLNPKRIIRKYQLKRKGDALPFVYNALNRLTARTIFKADRKTYKGAEAVQLFNPFQLALSDTTMAMRTLGLRSLLTVNRGKPYNFEFNHRLNNNKNLLSTGFEQRFIQAVGMKQRLQFKRRAKKSRLPKNTKLMMQLNIELGEQSSAADTIAFKTRNYGFQYLKGEPLLTLMQGTRFRSTLKYKYQNKFTPTDTIYARSNDLTLELTYSRSIKTNIRASLSYIKLNFNGDFNTPIGYAMAQGLQNGNNTLWRLTLNQRLSKLLQLQLSYEGRKTGDAPTVHVGRVQVRATF